MKKVLSILIVILFAVSLAADDGGKVSFKPDMRLIFHYGFDLNNETHLYNLERAYLGLKAKIDNVSFRITMDIKDVDIDDDGTQAVDLKGMYLKYAYAEIKKLIPLSKLIFGQQKTGLIDFEGKIWGHRAIAKVPLDMWGLDTSADVGLAVDAKLPGKLGGIHLGYFNGEGYKGSTSEDEQQKALSLRANINLGPIMLSGYAKTWWQPGGADNHNLFGAIVSFKNKMISAAAQFFMKDTGTTEQVISAYATFHAIPEKLDIFARFDMYDEDIDTDNDGKNVFMAGIKYNLAKKTAVYFGFGNTSYEASGTDSEQMIDIAFDQKF